MDNVISMGDKNKLAELIKNNIHGVIYRSDLIDWFLRVQETYKLSQGIIIKDLLKAAKEQGIVVIRDYNMYSLIKNNYVSKCKVTETKAKNKIKKQITKEDIIELYVNEGLTQQEIAAKFHIALLTLREKMLQYGIKPNRYRSTPKLSRKELEELYVEKKMTLEEISKIKRTTASTISNYLKLYGIKARKNGGLNKKDVGEEVKSLRKEGKTVLEIMDKLHISRRTYYRKIDEVGRNEYEKDTANRNCGRQDI